MTGPLSETIAALATAPGEAGIGVVRVSGPDALAVAGPLFQRTVGRGRWASFEADPESHRAYYGIVTRGPLSSDRLDDGLFTYFQGPRSYTGEDVVEFSCHGSRMVLSTLLTLLLAQGARLADPGEFTRRAFLNGRLDLASAEAVIDVIRAQSDSALRLANAQREGRLARAVRTEREALIALLAEIEAHIDFPEEVDPIPDSEVARRASDALSACRELLRTASAGRIYRDGAAVVLAGRPNVGKSSLLNALLGEERAIVTPIPGTTRDFLEEGLTLAGVPLRLIDTAGLRDSSDAIEQEGVRRARSRIEGADLVLWIVDASDGVTGDDREILELLGDRPLLAVANKIDLSDSGDWECEAAPGMTFLAVSAARGDGIERLKLRIAEMLTAGVPVDAVYLGNARQESRVHEAVRCLERAINAAEAGFDQAALSLDLRLATQALGELTGDSVTDETIEQIFARFCVGK